MSQANARKMSIATISMIIVIATFGIANVIDNLVELGLSAIPSWIAVGFLYFLPLALILAEFGSDMTESKGGIYSYMERGLGPTWAFVGTWSYFVANLIYLQSVFSRLPIRISLAITGEDVFETVTALLPFVGVAICLFFTFIATRGVRIFSVLADWSARGILLLTAILIVIPIALVLFTSRVSATPYSLEALTPSLDLRYFSTFAWLLFAVAGAEVAAPYVRQTDNPQRNFPRAIVITTLMIGVAYVLGTIAVSFAMPIESLTKATGLYDIWAFLAGLVGLPEQAMAKVCMTFIVLSSVAAYVVWMESPIRAMFSDVPAGTFPESLTSADAAGTHHRALWTQAGVVSILILVPLISILTGTSGSRTSSRCSTTWLRCPWWCRTSSSRWPTSGRGRRAWMPRSRWRVRARWPSGWGCWCWSCPALATWARGSMPCRRIPSTGSTWPWCTAARC